MVAFVAAKKTQLKKICSSCGQELPLTTGFYTSKSPLFAVDKKINICKECFISNALTESGEIDEVKFKNLLRKTDFPYYRDNLQSAANQYAKEHGYVADEDVKYHGADIIKLYMKNVNSLRQLSEKSFEDSEKDGFIQKRSTVLKEANEEIKMLNSVPDRSYAVSKNKKDNDDSKWTKKDKQNMKYVISTIGYDPYDDVGLSDLDKKYCYNILSGYCDTDGISEDGHKMQCVIEMSMLYCQCKKITEAMNDELNSQYRDDQKIQRLTSSKSSLLSSIAQIAKDNNISSNYNKNSKQGQSSLTSKMKEMEENGFQEITVNLFDIKTSEAFKQIDEISNNNIANQLTLDNNEYSEIVKEQREMIQKYDLELETLKEENRVLKNRIIDLENKKR